MASTRRPDVPFSADALAAVVFDRLAISRAANIRVAYSGGVDSTALLAALCEIRETSEIHVSAIHVDHGLHPESSRWARHCQRIGVELDVPVAVRAVSVNTVADDGIEGAARRVRYSVLQQELSEGEYLFMAHHQDDQAETVLLQLFRGAGVAGLAAMPHVSPFGLSKLVRPILGFSRAALQQYVLNRGLKWIEDPSNENLSLRRNFLRKKVMPSLGAVWPGSASRLAQSARHAADALEILDEVAGGDLSATRATDCQYASALSVSAISALPLPRLRNLIRYWLRIQDIRMPSSRIVRELEDQILRASVRARSCVSWFDCEIWRYRDLLIALRPRARPDQKLDLSWDLRVPFYHAGLGRLVVRTTSAEGLPALKPLAELRVRIRQGGERLRLPGRHHHSSVKKLIQEAGIPPWERPRLPLLYSGDRLVAVADRWIDESFVVKRGEPGYQLIWEPDSAVAAGNE